MKIGFIDNYLDEWHANNYPGWIKDVSHGGIEVAYAYALIDAPGGMTTDQWCKKNGVTRCRSIEELIEKSDGIVVLSPDHCELHEGLCQLPLRSGKPTYVDKTFAPDYATARRIFDIAEKSGTVCYSTSALRYASEYASIPSDIKAISSWGPMTFETYCVHQLEPIIMLMKADVRRVMYVPGDGWYTVLLDFADGRQASMTGFAAGSPFTLNVVTGEGNRIVTAESDFFHEFIVTLCNFFVHPTVKVPHEETLRIMAVRGTVLQAQKTPGEWVFVKV